MLCQSLSAQLRFSGMIYYDIMIKAGGKADGDQEHLFVYIP